MKQVLLFLIVLATLFPYSPSQAQSFTGGELTYDWVADSTFTFNLTLYSRCDSIYTLPQSADICYYNSCNSTSGSIPLVLVPQPFPFSNRYLYSGSFSLPSKCDYWTFHGTVSRTPSINLGNPIGLYVEATLNNMDAPMSSSPKFLIEPTTHVCMSQNAYLPLNPVDGNNDSLATEGLQNRTSASSIFSTCSGSSSSIPYIFPFTSVNPVNSPTGYAVDPTGYAMFLLDPSTPGYMSYAMRVNKYRKSDGKKLGSVMRDAQLRADTCSSAQQPPTFSLLPNTFMGCQLNGTQITTQVKTPFSFCFYTAMPPGSNHSLYLSSINMSQIFPTAAVTYNPITPDSIVCCVSYSPTVADVGYYSPIFRLKDSSFSVNPCDGPLGSLVLHHYWVLSVSVQDQLSINNLDNPHGISIYPNPSSTSISVRSSIPVNTTILSLDGRVLSESRSDNNVDIGGLSDGIYLIQIRDNTGGTIKVEKLIKSSVK